MYPNFILIDHHSQKDNSKEKKLPESEWDKVLKTSPLGESFLKSFDSFFKAPEKETKAV